MIVNMKTKCLVINEEECENKVLQYFMHLQNSVSLAGVMRCCETVQTKDLVWREAILSQI